jgi:hypothetical protein
MSVKSGTQIPMMFHPSHDVFDLEEAERWYERVFGCQSTPLSALAAADKLPAKQGSGYPPDYSTFTPIRDVLFDTIDPSRYVFKGEQKLPPITEPHLRMIVWYSEDMDGTYRTLREHDIRILNQMDEIVEGETAPTSFGSKMPLMFTAPEDAGLRYGLFPPSFATILDPRMRPDWVLSSVAAEPLGLERCSHHTILTDTPDRAVKFHTILGGDIVHEGRNDLLDASCTYIHLAGSVIEIAIPDPGTDAFRNWQKRAPNDTYHALTWKVADLDRAERHLAAEGVRIRARSPDTLITDPATSLGIPWGFTNKLMPGDPRSIKS